MDARGVFATTLQQAAQQCEVVINDEQAEQMWQHFSLLIGANHTVNLTRITDPAEAAAKHFVDSIMAARWAQEQAFSIHRVLDVGTGGGFPAIPLAIARPDWHITAIDGTGKKVRCVQQFIEQLHLNNCTVLQQHSDHWRQDIPPFDLILCRGVGSMPTTLRKMRHLCRPHSVVVFYKLYPLEDEEFHEAADRAPKLGFERLPPWSYALPVGDQLLSRQLCAYLRIPN